MKLRISDYAKIQIKNIADYGIKNWGQVKSDEYITDLFGVIEMLLQYPKAGVQFKYEWSFFAEEEIYFFPNKSHQIFYMILEDTVEVIAVGGSWQLPDSFLP